MAQSAATSPPEQISAPRRKKEVEVVGRGWRSRLEVKVRGLGQRLRSRMEVKVRGQGWRSEGQRFRGSEVRGRG